MPVRLRLPLPLGLLAAFACFMPLLLGFLLPAALLLQMAFGRLAGAFRFDYRLAYALPPIVMLLVSWLLFRRKSG